MTKLIPKLLDTGVFFDFYKGRQRSRIYFDRLVKQEIKGYISVISVAEMWRGIRANEVSDHEALLAQLTVLTLNAEIAKLSGLWMQQYAKTGLGWMDALIVSTASAHGLPIITRDAKLAGYLENEATFEVYR